MDTETVLYTKTNVVGQPKEPDNYPYLKAVRFDNRSFFTIFMAIYLDKEDLSKPCVPRSVFDLFSISINNIMFGICVDFLLNTLFYTDNQLSSRYKNGTLTFLQDLLRSVPSNIISVVIGALFNSFLSYTKILEMLVAEIKTRKISYFFTKYYPTIIKKLLMFHVTLFIIVLFGWYYLTLFCIIYVNFQMSWFTGCIYSVVTAILVNIAISLGLTVLRAIGMHYKLQYAYNLELYIKSML